MLCQRESGFFQFPFIVEEWDGVSQKAIRFALAISSDVIAVHVDLGEDTVDLSSKWSEYVGTPAHPAGLPAPDPVVLKSPYRYVITPIVDYILQLETMHPDRQVAVLIPTLVERHWFHRFLHNQGGELLTALLLLKGNQRIVIVNVPWFLTSECIHSQSSKLTGRTIWPIHTSNRIERKRLYLRHSLRENRNPSDHLISRCLYPRASGTSGAMRGLFDEAPLSWCSPRYVEPTP